ncbi:HPr family phosphocarrier protein [Entomospira entomophila]|uniref:Phosphocarrier protein HPr n=1 Tax=Entomospira entomophila TaxID=2719988 RepID=A0A968GBX8_9SPIO|nr:HPr family phosphocarrier protein [Entomospira entomophilus]NIZ40556.1 HPr family phosphocarrier protein [Entomospira entomophilus]WDI36114.1 HPr family phosphocarrier protein [Entomospira entomophilus]
MITKSVTITNPIGLHTRLAAGFVELTQKFYSDIKIQKGEIYCNAKEFLKILKLGITQGSQVTIWVQGEDEESAVTAIIDYLEHLEEKEIPMLNPEEAQQLLSKCKPL